MFKIKVLSNKSTLTLKLPWTSLDSNAGKLPFMGKQRGIVQNLKIPAILKSESLKVARPHHQMWPPKSIQE